jgi:FKBP-type peptidyl-prolyl cis-trans isomerase FklB
MLSAVFGMTSCSEKDDDTVEEFPNWESTNTTYFDNLYNTTTQKIAAGDATWKIIKSYNLPSGDDNTSTTTSTTTSSKAEDNIIIKVLQKGTGTGCPMFTDSVRVHYTGRLLPSTSYTDGYIFSRSYYSDYDLSLMTPTTMLVSSLTSGFSTAVQNMHIGDRWLVYVPYALGYGEDGSTSIPGYSTLVFDITLVSYYRSWVTYSAKAMSGAWIDE